jgi:parallel beta-helix repeat protein
MALRILALGAGLFLVLACACGGGGGGSSAAPADPAAVQLVPTTSTVASAGKLTLSATVTGTSDPSVTWTVDGISGGNAATGTLTGTGNIVTYTGPSVAGRHTVVATSVAVPSRSDSSLITVLAPNVVLVTLSPQGTIPLASGGSQTFQATATGASNTSLVWTVDGITDGTASTGYLDGTTGNTVTYSAPAAAGTHTITVTSQADPTRKQSAVVTVQAAGVPVVTLSPGDTTLAAGGSQAFTATVSGASNTAVTWSLAHASGATGSLSASTGATVTYAAPAAAGVDTVTATSQADTSRSASAVVTVSAAGTPVVTLQPGDTTVAAGATQSFTATVTGVSNTAVSWSLATTSGAAGSLSASTGATVTYTAPATAGVNRVIATSQADTSRSASAVVTVPAPAGVQVSLSPASSSLGVGLSQAFTASVTGTSNTAVSWTVDGVAGGNASVGTLAGTGLSVTYTAPAAAGSHTLTATSQADASASASAALTVLASNTINVKDSPYSAKGDGSTNDTAAIQRAITAKAGTGGTVFVPAGTYMISATTSLSMGSNMTLSLDPGAVLQAIPNSSGTYRILNIVGVSSVRVTGGALVGDRNTRSSSCGDSGVAIQVNGSSDVTVDGTAVRDTCGDGVYLTGSNRNVTFSNMTLGNCGRNGFGIVQGTGITVQGCTISGTNGLDPQLGVDVEPNPGQTVSGLLVDRCTVTGNAGGGIGLGPSTSNYQNAWVTGCTVSNCTVTGNTAFGIAVSACDGNALTGNSVSGTVQTAQSDGNGILTYSYATNTTITGNTCTANGYDGIQLGQCAGSVVTGNTSNNNRHHGINNLSGSGASVSNNTTTGNGINP